MQVNLSSEERRLLSELLDQGLRDLKEEINKTETYAYKEALHARRGTLVGLIEKVGDTVDA
jgi:hypothetical protein